MISHAFSNFVRFLKIWNISIVSQQWVLYGVVSNDWNEIMCMTWLGTISSCIIIAVYGSMLLRMGFMIFLLSSFMFRI